MSKGKNHDAGFKVRILLAVRKVDGEETAQLLDHLKKVEMTTEA